MKKKIFLKILKYLLSLAFAFGIIYLLFKNQDPIKLLKEIQKVEIKWAIFSMIFGAWAYVSRAFRWILLIETLNYKTSKLNSIAAVSVLYFTNLFIPRAGEISRCTSLNQVERIPVDKLLGTILIERVIDFLVFFVLIFFTIFFKFNEIMNFYFAINSQETTIAKSNTSLQIITILFLIMTFIFTKKYLKKTSFYDKIINFLNGIKEGFQSIKYMKKKSLFWFHTFSIWIMYFLMTYICFFSMSETAHLSLGDGLFILVLGGIGMIIPTPGGIGSYHAIVMIGLSVLGVGEMFLVNDGDASNPALLFPTIIHASQTLVAIIMGLIGLWILTLAKNKNNVKSK